MLRVSLDKFVLESELLSPGHHRREVLHRSAEQARLIEACTRVRIKEGGVFQRGSRSPQLPRVKLALHGWHSSAAPTPQSRRI